MSQKNFQIFRSQISDLKTDNVDYLKKPPWKKFFFDIFAIHLTSRYEKRCRMLQRLFSLFQGSKNQLWVVQSFIHLIPFKVHDICILVQYYIHYMIPSGNYRYYLSSYMNHVVRRPNIVIDYTRFLVKSGNF